MISNHATHLYKLRGEQTEEVTTRILVAPRTGKFIKGETLTYAADFRNQYSVEFIKSDGPDRSFVLKNGTPVSVYTYQLSR